MIYQPRSIQPIHKSIDGTKQNEISMVMNTTDYVSAYKLTIYNMDNTVFYSGSKTNFDDNLYNGDTGYIDLPTSLNLVNGKDYKWTARLYQNESNMLITYGNVISPETYTYTVGSGGLTVGNYAFNVEGYSYVFAVMKNLVQSDILSLDISSGLVSLISPSTSSSYYLSTTTVDSGTFGTLPGTTSGTKYTYSVGSAGLPAGKYCFSISGTSYWFTTLSDLDSGDSVAYDSSTGLITQTHVQSGTNIVLTLSYVSGKVLTATKSYNTSTNIYLQRNINIKDGMYLQIGSQKKQISSYEVSTGLAIVSSAFSGVPDAGTPYEIYSDFIEMTPENILYVRATPTVTIGGASATLTSKNATFNGTYSQSNGVPLVYYLWNLYSIDNGGLTLVKTSKKTYSSNIKFEYDGFKNGATYSLVLVCENEFGIIVNAEKTFLVSYEEITYDEQPTANQTNEQGIRVSWLTTIPTEPYSVYIKNAEGYIQSPDNTKTSLWLEAGQEIYPNTTIKVGLIEAEGIIATYNINTGFATLQEELSYIPTSGEYYYIYSQPNYNLNGINIETNTPYSGVNSAAIGDNHLIYEKNTGLAVWPDDYQLTMQFLLEPDFFYGDNNVYQDMALIARYEGNDPSGEEDLLVFARGYNFYAIIPSVKNNSLVTGTVSAISDDGLSVTISMNSALNPDRQKFICFIEQEFVGYIDSYDAQTNTITFDKSIPQESRPEVGDAFFLYDTVTASYYDTPNNVFVLQNVNFASPYSDYIWTDSGIWQDSYYWVEGGTAAVRASNTWWKIQITKDSMIIGRGGV